MKRFCRLLSVSFLLLSLAACSNSPVGSPWQRESNIRVGPERVFPRPITEIMPELAGAQALSGGSGRLGPSLVYWPYELADSTQVYLFGCGLFQGHYCEEAVPRICPRGETEELARRVEPGNVIRERCRFVGTAAPGDLYPNCDKTEFEHDILVGLVSCQ